MKKTITAVVLGVIVFILVVYVTTSERAKLNNRLDDLQRAIQHNNSARTTQRASNITENFTVMVRVDKEGHVVPTGIIR